MRSTNFEWRDWSPAHVGTSQYQHSSMTNNRVTSSIIDDNQNNSREYQKQK